MNKFNKGLFTNLIDGAILIDKIKPINQSQSNEAITKGLKLIYRSTNPNYNYYQHTSCNHFSFLQPTHIRRNSFICNTCFHYGLTEEAHVKGLHFVHTVGEQRKYIRSCGHILVTSSQFVKESETLNCSDCFEETLQKAANKNGYEYIDKKSKGLRKIRFKSCGHFKTTHQSQIQKGNVVCRECIDLEHINKCKNLGITLVSKSENSRYGEYLLPCGHQKTLRVDHAEVGCYLCDTCEDTHYSKPSQIYLLKIKYNNFSWLKLGFAKDIKLRKASYGLPSGSEVEELYVVQCRTGRIAMDFEKSLHRYFKKDRYPKKIMKDFHSFNGFTECYPIELEEQIQSELIKFKEDNIE